MIYRDGKSPENAQGEESENLHLVGTCYVQLTIGGKDNGAKCRDNNSMISDKRCYLFAGD